MHTIERVDVDGTSTHHQPRGTTWTLPELQELLGGYVAPVSVPGSPEIVALVDEDGRPRRLPINAAASRRCGRNLVGPVLFAPRSVLK